MNADRSWMFFLIFALFWSSITGAFDAMLVRTLYRQTRAQSFARVEGRIVRSEVERRSGSDGPTYRANIEFDYEVQGTEYRSETYRFGQVSTSSREPAERAVRAYPVGATVTVYYDAADPYQAVLETGVGTGDLFLLIFLTPFNLVGLGIWIYLLRLLAWKLRPPPAGGYRVIHQPYGVHVRLPRWPLGLPAVAWIGGSAFVSVFVIGFGMNLNPSMPAITVILVLIVVPAVFIYWWRSYLVGSGVKDLIINEDEDTLTFPITFDRKEPVSIPLSIVRRVSVDKIITRNSEGSSTRFDVNLEHESEDDPHRIVKSKLIETGSRWRADELANWLMNRLSLNLPDGS